MSKRMVRKMKMKYFNAKIKKDRKGKYQKGNQTGKPEYIDKLIRVHM